MRWVNVIILFYIVNKFVGTMKDINSKKYIFLSS